MEDLYEKIEANHTEVVGERKKLITKIDQLINEITKTRDQIEDQVEDKKAVNNLMTGCVKKG